MHGLGVFGTMSDAVGEPENFHASADFQKQSADFQLTARRFFTHSTEIKFCLARRE